MELLARRGIPFNTGAVYRASFQAAAKAVDPCAELRRLRAVSTPADASVRSAERWQEGICYLRIRGLHADAARSIRSQLLRWEKEHCEGLILDLRNADGTNYPAVCELAGFLLGTTNSLYKLTDLHGGTLETLSAASAETPRKSVPLLILANRATQEAAELMVAVVKGQKGVMVIGERTRGDASIRELIPLNKKEGLWIATGRVLPSRGPDYHRRGVSPDVIAASTRRETVTTNDIPVESLSGHPLSDKAKADRELMQRVATDPCLSRATEILLALKALQQEGKPAGAKTAVSHE